MKSIVRYILILLVTVFCINYSYGQLRGDLNGDGILDATDYFILQKSMSTSNAKHFYDLNDDGASNVADMMVLENYMYREGKSDFTKKDKEEHPPLIIAPGTINIDSSYIDILMYTEVPVAAFEFQIAGVDSLVKVSGGAAKDKTDIYLTGNKVVAIPGKRAVKQLFKSNLLRLKYYSKQPITEICITQPVFVKDDATIIPSRVGDCATAYYTLKGLDRIKSIVKGLSPQDSKSDVNKDGYVDILDVYQLEDFLLRSGKLPGYNFESEGKIKVGIHKVDLDSQFIWVQTKTSSAIASFQLQLHGVNGLEIIEEGSAMSNELEVMTEKNKVFGFLNEGLPILPDDKLLLKVKYKAVDNENLCVLFPIFISSDGNTLLTKTEECVSLIKEIPGCMDSTALNFNPLANLDDNSCEYPPKPKKEKPPKEEKPEKTKEVKSNKTAEKKKAEVDEVVAEDVVKVKKERNKEKNKEDKSNLNKETSEKKSKSNTKHKEGKKPEPKQKEVNENVAKKKAEKDDEAIEDKKEEVIAEEFEVESAKSGILVPQVTAEQRLSISNPAKGLMVFDIDVNSFVIFDGQKWKVVGNGNGTGLKRMIKKFGVWKAK